MKKIIFLTLLFCNCIASNIVWALPDKIDIFFIQGESKNISFDIEPFIPKISHSQKLAQNCVPMGDGCFHPQLGYQETKEKTMDGKARPSELELNHFHKRDNQFIDCKEGYYFDIYCGKSKENTKKKMLSKSNLEIWIDTSASMKNVDYSKDENYCGRRSFVSRIFETCSSDVLFYTFDTNKKEMDSRDSICVNRGGNNQERLMKWISEVETKHLVIVTDIDEQSQRFTDFLNSHQATIHGLGTSEGFTTVDLIAYAETLAKSCRPPKK